MDIEWDELQRQAPPAAPVRKHVSPGMHTVTVVSAEEATSKKGHPMLKLVLGVVGGLDHGLHVYEYLNIGHPNASVKEIALAKLRELSAAVGINRKFNTSELAGKTCKVKVYLEDGGSYGLTARVRSYSVAEVIDDMEAADLPF